MTRQQQQQIAYEMTLEYFKQNELFVRSKGQEDVIVKEFAEIENEFYKSLTKHSKLFDMCL